MILTSILPTNASKLISKKFMAKEVFLLLKWLEVFCNNGFAIPTTHLFFCMFDQMDIARLHFETDKFIFVRFGVVLISRFRLMNALSLLSLHQSGHGY